MNTEHKLIPATMFSFGISGACCLALGTESVRGNELGISWMTLAGSAGGILTPAAVGFVAERAGIQAGMGIVAIMTVLLLVTILISYSTNRSSGKNAVTSVHR